SPEAHSKVVAAAPAFGAKERAERRWIAQVHALEARVRDNPPARRLKALTEVDVFARFEGRVEALDRLERRAAHDEIPGSQPRRVAGSRRPASQRAVRALDPGAVAWRRVDRAGGADFFVVVEDAHRRVGPLGCDFVIGVDKRENVAARSLGSAI